MHHFSVFFFVKAAFLQTSASFQALFHHNYSKLVQINLFLIASKAMAKTFNKAYSIVNTCHPFSKQKVHVSPLLIL